MHSIEEVKNISRKAVEKWGDSSAVKKVLGDGVKFDDWLNNGIVRDNKKQKSAFAWLRNSVNNKTSN